MVATAAPRITVDEQAPAPDPLAMLEAMAGSQTPRKKGGVPTVHRPDLADAIKSWHELKAKEDHYKSLKQTVEAQLKAAAHDERLKESRRAHEVIATVKLEAQVMGNDGKERPMSLSVTQQCRYCQIKTTTPAEKQRFAELQAAFGADAPRFFAKQMSVELTEAAIEDQGWLAGFVKLMVETYGAEEFARRFKVTNTFMPTKLFHERYTLDPATQAAAEPFTSDETVKAFSASVKQ